MLKKYILLFLFTIIVMSLTACRDQEINDQIILPDLTGMNKEQIEYEMSRLDLDYTFEEVIHNTIRTNRFVAYGNPYVSGMEIEPQTAIIIYVVKYANKLPELSGLNQDEIIEILSLYDLSIQFEYKQSNLVLEGFFFSYEEGYKTGDILDLGSNLTIYLAETLTIQITLPDLRFLYTYEIIEVLDSLNIKYTIEEVTNNNLPNNQFISYQDSYQAGDQIAENEYIIVYIAKNLPTLPHLGGLNLEEITELFAKKQLIATFEYIESNQVQSGYFVAYEEGYSTGMPYEPGLEIKIYLAIPVIQKIELPNLNFLYAFEIMEMLDQLGIDYAIEEITNNNVPEGQFISYGNGLQTGDKIFESEGIIVYIAKHVNMLPELEGLNQNQIYIELLKIDVIIEFQTITTNDVEAGTFVSYGRNRVPGDIVNKGISIIVYIATPIIIVNRSLMITTYLEGTLFNRALEVYNRSDDVLDLSNYQIAHYIDGSEFASSIIELTGSLNPKETYVIAHPNSDLALLDKADLITSDLLFNGNDAVAIRYFNQEIIDVVGVIGWGLFYLDDQTFVRKSNITEPNTSFSIQEWDVYTKDYHDVIGVHPHQYPLTFTFDPYYLTLPFSEKGGVIKVDFVSNNDGDTAQFTPGFTNENRVRFIGVDTPETGSGIVATQARQFVYNRLSRATTIYLQHDPASGNIETYGRYLALIWADGVLLNYELVLYGYSQNNYQDARYNLSFNGVSLSRWMTNAEEHAKTNRLGVWG
jgi:endonuclease YncB( thermonuclease family)/beta-lactam-binding protein with PASTA domain